MKKNYYKEIIIKPAKRLLAELKQSENEVKKAITEYLEWQGWTVYPIGNKGGFRGYNKDGKIRFSFAGKKGVADLYAVKRYYRPLWVEVKATGKKPSKAQWDFIWRVNSAYGGWWVWADSLDSFKSL